VEFFPQGKYSKANAFFGHTPVRPYNYEAWSIFPQGKYSKANAFFGHTPVRPYD
jgi:hypothetical protein